MGDSHGRSPSMRKTTTLTITGYEIFDRKRIVDHFVNPGVLPENLPTIAVARISSRHLSIAAEIDMQKLHRADRPRHVYDHRHRSRWLHRPCRHAIRPR